MKWNEPHRTDETTDFPSDLARLGVAGGNVIRVPFDDDAPLPELAAAGTRGDVRALVPLY